MRRLLRTLALVSALAAAACTTSGTTRPTQTEDRNESGFVIREDVSPSFSVRSDFEQALQLLEQKHYDDGIALLVKVTEAAPNLTSAHFDLAIAYEQVGDLANAEASIKRALELSPRHPAAYNELGIIYRRTGRFQMARESYEKALELHPEFHFARRNLAILCDVFMADLPCALQNYELYAQAVPDDAAAAIWIADLHKRIGK
jgi:Tfp pilus assembly protein PilF